MSHAISKLRYAYLLEDAVATKMQRERENEESSPRPIISLIHSYDAKIKAHEEEGDALSTWTSSSLAAYI